MQLLKLTIQVEDNPINRELIESLVPTVEPTVEKCFGPHKTCKVETVEVMYFNTRAPTSNVGN